MQGGDTHSPVDAISVSLVEMLGTAVGANLPLMATGLDSVGAIEFANSMMERYNTEIQQTLLFDHPTIESVA